MESIEKMAETLGDRGKTWVERRDAATQLAQAAQRALAALRAHAGDADTDVRLAVENGLAELGASASEEAEGPKTVADLVEACAKPGRREVHREGDGFRVEVSLKQGRKQHVYIRRSTRGDGIRLVHVYTPCGLAQEDAYDWCLRANMKLIQSCFALENKDDGPNFALVRTFLDGAVTKAEMHAAIKEVAHYGDWVENKMTGRDEL